MVEPQKEIQDKANQTIQKGKEKLKQGVGKLFGGGGFDPDDPRKIEEVRKNLFLAGVHVPDVNPDGTRRTSTQMRDAVMDALAEWQVKNGLANEEKVSNVVKALDKKADAIRPDKKKFDLNNPDTLAIIRNSLKAFGVVNDKNPDGSPKSADQMKSETLVEYRKLKNDRAPDAKDHEFFVDLQLAAADKNASSKIEAEKARKAAEEKEKQRLEDERIQREALKKAKEDAAREAAEKEKNKKVPPKKPLPPKRKPTAEALETPDGLHINSGSLPVLAGVTHDGDQPNLPLSEVAQNLLNTGTAPDGKADDGQKKPDETPVQRDNSQRTV